MKYLRKMIQVDLDFLRNEAWCCPGSPHSEYDNFHASSLIGAGMVFRCIYRQGETACDTGSPPARNVSDRDKKMWGRTARKTHTHFEMLELSWDYFKKVAIPNQIPWTVPTP